MKKGRSILLLIFALSFCLVIGIFIGRNHKSEYVQLPNNSIHDSLLTQDTPDDYRLDINNATKAQLMDLPGIGEELAQRIINYRTTNGPFQTTDDLMEVEGIGEKKLLQIEMLIKIGG